MGGSDSKTENKNEANGQVVNNVNVKNTVDFFNLEMTILIAIICGIKIIELMFWLYRCHTRNIKRRAEFITKTNAGGSNA